MFIDYFASNDPHQLRIRAVVCIWGGPLGALGVHLFALWAVVYIWGGPVGALRVQLLVMRVVVRRPSSRPGVQPSGTTKVGCRGGSLNVEGCWGFSI